MKKENQEKTIFQKIAEREIPADILYEDDKVIAFLDIVPFEKGHSVVVPKHPYQTIWDMPESEYLHLQSIVHKLAGHIHKTMDTPAAVFQRNLPGAGQVVPHVHVLVVPRHTSEDEKPIFNDGPKNSISYAEGEKQQFVEKLKMV